jgi:S-formylglutathione hydrolase FrmB
MARGNAPCQPARRARVLTVSPHLSGAAALVAALTLIGGCTVTPSVRRPSGSTSPPTTARSSSRPVTVPAAGAAGPPPSASRSPARRRVDLRPSGGAILERVDIPASDGFRPRPAYLYLPPSAVRHAHRRLPVLELLHGTPGQPVDWVNGGLLISIVNAFTATHHGQGPIIVMPDLNGTHRGDSECIRTAAGFDIERYLTSDVVRWVRAHFTPTVGREKWWVAGLSEGGLCSLMLTLRHPHVFSALGDLSGFAAPIVDHLTQAASDRQLYGGNAREKREHDPLWLLKHHSYTALPAWFECGADDRRVLPQQRLVVAAARAAGMHVHDSTVPGSHGWTVWSAALRTLLPWLWTRR